MYCIVFFARAIGRGSTNLSVRVTCSVVMAWATLVCVASWVVLGGSKVIGSSE